jgi:hypothetical protein
MLLKYTHAATHNVMREREREREKREREREKRGKRDSEAGATKSEVKG